VSLAAALAADRGSVLEPQGPRWLNAWTERAPLTDRELEAVVAAPELPFATDDAPRSALCVPDALVTGAGWTGARVGARHRVLTGVLVAGRPGPAVLRLGVRGRVRVWHNGKLAVDRESQPGLPPLADEVLAPLDLAAGANRFAVALSPLAQAGAEAPALMARVGAPDGRLLDLRWGLTHGARCSAGQLTHAEIEPRIDEVGLAPKLRLSIPGLWPLAGDVRVVAQVDDAARARPARAEQLVAAPFEERLPRDRLLAGFERELRIPMDRAGTRTLRLSMGDDGAVERTFPLHHRGEVASRLAQLATRFLHGNSRDPRPAVLPESIDGDARASFEHDLRTMVVASESGHLDVAWLRKRTEFLEAMVPILERGEDPYRDRVGVVHRAYRSPLDGKLQPYVLFVPPRLRRAKGPLPLVVVAHGLNHDASLALRIAFGEGPEEDDDRGFATRHLPPLPDLGALVLAPGGYRDAGPRTVGEADILDAVAAVRAHYPVDDRRIAITGYSLGGTVSFALPLHYPSLFSAAAPLCGYPNLLGYSEVRNVPHQPFEDVMLARRYLANYAENGLHIPLHIVHGQNDGPERSAVVADRYRELGQPRIFEILKDTGHNVWDDAYEEGKMLAWLGLRKRPERPEHVRLRTGELRYDRAHWVRLLAREREEALASIDAKLDRRERTITVTTSGVAAFALDVTALEAERVLVDGQPLAIQPGDGERFFVRRGGAFEASAVAPDRSGKKRPGVAGPLDDVLRHPLVIVYGTQLPAETEVNRLVAETWSSTDSWVGARFPVLADRDVAEADLAGRSIVLIGRPASNALTAKLAAALPVTFEDRALVFRGVRHEGDDVGLSMIRPSPLDPEQYVVLHAGTGYAGTLASRHLPRLAPDFTIYDAGILVTRSGELLGARTLRDAGFFDDDWR